MRRTKPLRTIALAVSLASGLGGCAAPFDASVSRFAHELPVPVGQTFAIVAIDQHNAGGLEFSQYAALVGEHLQKLGYVQGNPETADLVVEFDYGVDRGRDKLSLRGPDASGPTSREMGQPALYTGGSNGVGLYGSGLSSVGYYGGINDGNRLGHGLHDAGLRNVDVTTVYASNVNMRIKRRSDGIRIFEGKAQALSPSNRLGYLVPNLVEALFTGFPGQSGKTTQVAIPAEKKQNSVMQKARTDLLK